jgi:hypothetical protein
MVKINGFNVVKMLYDELDTSKKKSTQITAQEIYLKELFLGKFAFRLMITKRELFHFNFFQILSIIVCDQVIIIVMQNKI